MTTSHCMHRAMSIAKQPLKSWSALIEAIPETCEHDDCGNPRNCRQRIAEYLRMQWRMAERRKS